MRTVYLVIILLFIQLTMTITANPLLSAYKTPYQTIPFDKIKITDYEPAFESAMKSHDAEIQKIVNNKAKPTFRNTVEALEYSGETLGKVSSVFFNLLSAESNDEMRTISQRIQPKLTDHSNNINLNEQLFQKVKAVYDQKDQLELNVEQMRLLQDTYDGFVNRGANLNVQDKDKYRELSSKLSRLTLMFGQNVLKATNAYELLLTDEKQLNGLPQGEKDAAAQRAKAKDKAGWLIDLSAPSYVAFMKYATDRNLRKELYLAYNTRCTSGEFSNADNVTEIAGTRLAIANLLGYKSYADQVLKRRMAGNAANVYELLNELLTGFTPAALQEYREVQGFAIGKESKNIEVMPYDWSFYSEKLKDAKFDLNDEMVRPYFELENVKKGVFGLATQLYGITFRKNTKIPVYNPEVEAFEVYKEDGEFLAVLYTDFHPRAAKNPGAWMSEFRGQEVRNGKNVRPHVTIVMNFTRPTENNPALLTFDEVETFLHEFGHALHGMFANTVYPGLSGTGVYRDFVELPSQIMENFLLEKVYLDGFAKHYQTGETIPAGLVKKIVDAANFNAGYLCLRQLSFGYLDMAFHTINKPVSVKPGDFEKEALARTAVLPSVENVLISTAFSHIFSGGYAAGYYSYKWAEVLDADAYALFKENGVISKEIARKFYENILSKGGTEDPMELYIKFRGQKPSTDALMKRSGIKK
ncbi:MAG: M3 family metallopeptidase [Dysgonamonadaceae bacterium]|nr:M3 family metallopeptidase [Dysgonamonadaceae bacterium]